MKSTGYIIKENSKNYPNLDKYLEEKLDDRFGHMVVGLFNALTQEMSNEEYYIVVKNHEQMTDEELTSTMEELGNYLKAIGLHPVKKYILA